MPREAKSDSGQRHDRRCEQQPRASGLEIGPQRNVSGIHHPYGENAAAPRQQASPQLCRTWRAANSQSASGAGAGSVHNRALLHECCLTRRRATARASSEIGDVRAGDRKGAPARQASPLMIHRALASGLAQQPRLETSRGQCDPESRQVQPNVKIWDRRGDPGSSSPCAVHRVHPEPSCW